MNRSILPALPALILLFVFFLFPVVRMLGFSVEGGTLDWYAKALGEELYLRVLLEHVRDRRCWSPSSACCWAIRWAS